jgi:hypothetical protein
MSKMRLASSAGLLVTIVFAAVLSGCSHVDVNSPQIRGIAYVDMDEVVKHHPLYAQLSQLNAAIAAIDLQSASSNVPRSAAEVASATQQLNVQLRQAQDRANKILAQKQQMYASREQQAVNAALAAAGVKSAGGQTASTMTATSAQQAQVAAAQANRDFMNYQKSVIAQNNAAVNTIARQLQAQADQKLRARAEQYQQNETDLALRLAQQDASQRLSIRTRLSNLALDDATRKQLQTQLATLDKKEADQVNALRSSDASALATYRSQLSGQTASQIHQQVATIQSQTTAKITARRNAVGQQLRSLGPAPLPSNLPAGTRAKLQQIHQQFTAQFQADAQKTIQEYNNTKSDLDRQFAALHGQDVGATGSAAKELSSLQKQHDDLTKQIDDQIQREAQRIGSQLGFKVVFSNVMAASGGYDMTNDLIHDVESLHE